MSNQCVGVCLFANLLAVCVEHICIGVIPAILTTRHSHELRRAKHLIIWLVGLAYSVVVNEDNILTEVLSRT